MVKVCPALCIYTAILTAYSDTGDERFRNITRGTSGIGDLEEFANLIDSFPAWWNRMKIDASSQEYRTQAIQINYDSLREKSVIHKWRQLVGQYADYTDQV